MSIMSIRVDDNKRKALKVIASIEGKTMGSIVSGLIEEYISKNQSKLSQRPENSELISLMKMSERSFTEWDNEEDEVYDRL